MRVRVLCLTRMAFEAAPPRVLIRSLLGRTPTQPSPIEGEG